MKTILTIAAVLLAGTAQATTLQDAVNSTYKLHEAMTPYCSSTFVGNNDEGAIFLTAAHCVADDGVMNVRIQNKSDEEKTFGDVLSEEVFYLKAVKTLKGDDVAILQTTAKVHFPDVPVDIATEDEAKKVLKIGTPVTTIGYPKAQIVAVTTGEYTGKVPPPDGGPWEVPMYQITSPITGGNSGGGLFVEINGTLKLVGVNVAGYRDVSFMNYSSTISSVKKVLTGFLKTDGKKAEGTSPYVPTPTIGSSGKVDEL